MKASFKKSRPPPSGVRLLNLHGAFRPEGGHEDDQTSFFEFCLAAQARLTALKKKDLRRRKSEFANFRKFAGKAGPIFHRAMHGEISPEEAKEGIKRLVPDEKLRRVVFDHWAKIYQTTPKQLEKNKQEIAHDEKRLELDERILKARKAITHWVEVLNEMAVAGDEEAAEALWEAAYLPGLAVLALENQDSGMMVRIACRQTIWPVLADGKRGWEKRAAERLTRLNLGSDMTAFRARFRQPRGADVGLPARKWAKAAVRAIEDTRRRHLIFGGLLKGFKTSGDMVDFMLASGWGYGKTPDWGKDISRLGSFSGESLPAWKRAIRKLIRQQVPDFDTRAEWATQRASAIARGRGTPGEIQNAILDDICSALERIAPAGTCGI